MSNDGESRLELAELERRLETISARLQVVEQALVARGVLVDSRLGPKPPIQATSPAFDVGAPVAPPPQLSSPLRGPDAEFAFGSRVLPRVGAAVVLLALAILVGVGIQRGWITPTVQFVGALGICALFIVLGIAKLGERENFGQVLIGIGSCGLYLTFAAGNVFHRLYEGEVLVAQFFALSVVNLAFSLARGSLTFFVIGLIGGLSAALMPLDRQDFNLNVALHMAIVIPAAGIAAKRRWSGGAVGLWFAATLATLPGVWSDYDWNLQALFAGLNGLACAAGYAAGFQKNEFDPKAVFTAIPILVAAGMIMGLRPTAEGSAAVAWLALASFALSFAFRDRNARNAGWFASASSVLVFGPSGFGATEAIGGYAAGSLICLVGTLWQPKAGASLAWVTLMLAFARYLDAVTLGKVGWTGDATVVLSLLGLSVGCAWATERAWSKNRWSAHLGLALGIGFWSRLLVVVLPNLVEGVNASLALSLAWIAAGVLLLSAGFALKSRQTRLWGLVALSAALLKALLVDIGEFDPLVKAGLLMATGLALVVVGYAYLRLRARDGDA